jgi:hypothetical protein
MAFIATNEAAVTVYPAIKSIAARVRQVAVTALAATNGTVDADQLLNLMRNMRQSLDSLNSLAVTPGIVVYAKEQEGDDNYDVAAEFTAMKSAMTSVGQWIAVNLPRDSNDYLLLWTLSGTTPVPRTFTAAQLTGLQTELQALINAISV